MHQYCCIIKLHAKKNGYWKCLSLASFHSLQWKFNEDIMLFNGINIFRFLTFIVAGMNYNSTMVFELQNRFCTHFSTYFLVATAWVWVKMMSQSTNIVWNLLQDSEKCPKRYVHISNPFEAIAIHIVTVKIIRNIRNICINEPDSYETIWKSNLLDTIRSSLCRFQFHEFLAATQKQIL